MGAFAFARGPMIILLIWSPLSLFRFSKSSVVWPSSTLRRIRKISSVAGLFFFISVLG
jgi:hypothetical protein